MEANIERKYLMDYSIFYYTSRSQKTLAEGRWANSDMFMEYASEIVAIAKASFKSHLRD